MPRKAYHAYLAQAEEQFLKGITHMNMVVRRVQSYANIRFMVVLHLL
ncbi:hypothetical protein C817_03128 [Dorea sp. 5-2]|nr:hypothetical protein C817_03128 [Dorea sp. 5-2]